MVYLPLFTYIWLIFMVNVVKYTIHGCYGYGHLAIFWCYKSHQTLGCGPLASNSHHQDYCRSSGELRNKSSFATVIQIVANQPTPPLTYPTQK